MARLSTRVLDTENGVRVSAVRIGFLSVVAGAKSSFKSDFLNRFSDFGCIRKRPRASAGITVALFCGYRPLGV